MIQTIQNMRQNTFQTYPAQRKQLVIKKNPQFFKVNVYNYFLDDFPKSYILSFNDTIQQLKEKIIQDTTQIRLMDIKKFKGQDGKNVYDNQILSQFYQNDCTLNMEILFNQDLKITTNSKNVQVFMFDPQNSNQIYDSIIKYYKSEKGGKILLGVQSDGLIKGINIPDQEKFKEDFIESFNQNINLGKKILKYVDISFFRVKGQNKNTYNFSDHKKIVIIKIQGKNKQKQEEQSQVSTDDEEENQIQNSENEDNHQNSPVSQNKFQYYEQKEMYFSPFQYSNPETIQSFIESLAF
ncbi:hypothetical protein TTHERM_00467590 (macronuclear) [Tetrahymena thermophila SB210]|uniref:Uncharacterized protein n=1 Tax=Tetrahymena thermophila (strain SB210) TaxID=312017 RepID=I7LXK3_TETTS|nr:hypothetical protein TTHERM_00467590 [Tetrahymena thermophila SB210]EAS04810.2 hypothetical protein TTHERM_00467590 [Tetrahymena thermophila SB210]|eukprot:XP_001025055.2 hypothetical protein TTHERM_00467590 [Tetrahymena thermophila SB210]